VFFVLFWRVFSTATRTIGPLSLAVFVAAVCRYQGFAEPDKEQMATLQASRRVLILDDEQVIANTLALILNRNGFEAQAVYTAQDAITTAALLFPDVLISDVIMEGMTGIDAAIRISQLVPSCRIILFSGQAATADLLQRAEADGHHFEILVKPIHPRVLLERLADSEQDS
jgi:CheY-like chemotaxis protein